MKKDNKEPQQQSKEKKETAPPPINPDHIKPGMTIKVYQRIKDLTTKGEEKERVQMFEGIVLAKRGKKMPHVNILVRKIAAGGIGVEKIFPLGSPTLVKIEPVKQAWVSRAKLYYLRNHKKRLKEKKLT